MNRDQFLRALKKHCRKNNLSYEWRADEGKGAHGTVYVAGKKTIIQSGELPNFYTDEVLKQLGIGKGAV